MARKGFLQALGDMCVVATDPHTRYHMSIKDIIECLKGAIEVFEREEAGQ